MAELFLDERGGAAFSTMTMHCPSESCFSCIDADVVFHEATGRSRRRNGSVMKNQIFVGACLVISLAACASQVELPSDSGLGGHSSSSNAASGTSAGTGGSGQISPPPCFVDPKMMEVTNPSCADLSAFTLADPKVEDDSGDGLVSAGEGATISVVIRENSGKGFMAYPGAKFSTDHGGASIAPDTWLFGIAGCETAVLSAYATFSNDITKGTVVNVTAKVAMLNGDCPDTSSLVIPIEVF